MQLTFISLRNSSLFLNMTSITLHPFARPSTPSFFLYSFSLFSFSFLLSSIFFFYFSSFFIFIFSSFFFLFLLSNSTSLLSSSLVIINPLEQHPEFLLADIVVPPQISGNLSPSFKPIPAYFFLIRQLVGDTHHKVVCVDLPTNPCP